MQIITGSAERTAGIMKDLPTIETERLTLRKLKADDAQDIYDYAKDPEISKYTVFEHHNCVENAKDYINWALDGYRKGTPENWAVVLKGSGRVIGTCGYFDVDHENMIGEIHYALSLKHSRKGYMSEAVKAIIDFGFSTLGLNRIEARCMTGNAASEKVMQKCGMKYEGIMREVLFAKNRYHDMKLYAIIKKDLQAVK